MDTDQENSPTGFEGARFHARKGTASRPLTPEAWHAQQTLREVAIAALKAATAERREKDKARHEQTEDSPLIGGDVWFDVLFRTPNAGCADCEWYGELCEEHTHREEVAIDTGITDRKMNATGQLSDPRLCQWCAAEFQAVKRRGQPSVTCSDDCSRARVRAQDRARKAGHPYLLPEAVRAAQEALDDLWTRPLILPDWSGNGFDPDLAGFSPLSAIIE